MKYLFFDIECACVYKYVAKICAFGYVLTDEHFTVLEKEDILLNPKGKFHLTDRKGSEGLVLPYEYEDFKKYPLFPSAYRRIRELLESKEVLVCGHATINDVNYLNLETKRYRLPSFRFRFYDTQFFYMNVQKDFLRQYGLPAMGKELGVEFTPHRAVDDAYATMRVLEALCKRENTDFRGLISRYEVKAGKIERYEITPLNSAGRERYFAEREEQREAHMKAHEEFYRYVNRYMHRRKKGGALEGKVFCFSKELEENVPVSQKLVEAIFASGGRYTSHPTECNVYIAYDDEGTRCRNAMNAGAAFFPFQSLESALSML